MKARLALPLLAVAVIGLGMAAWSGSAADMLRCSPVARPCLHVLFVGNSYTYENDLPGTFAALAASGGYGVSTAMVATGGATLADHAASGVTQAAIRELARGVVLLQEQSQIPAADPERQTVMFPAVRSLVDATRSANAEPVLFSSWAHLDGWPERGLGYAAMQSAIDAGYGAIANELAVRIAPVGDAFRASLGADPSIELWSADGSHPSPAGTYLAACVIYGTLFAASPDGLAYHANLDPAVTRALQAIAAAATVPGTR